MRIAILFVLLGIHAFAFANGYLHSNVTYTLQPGEIRNFYLPQQIGSVSVHFLEDLSDRNISFGFSPVGMNDYNNFIRNGDEPKVYAGIYSDTCDWYASFWNEETAQPTTISLAFEIHETITATGDSVNLNLIPYALQYVRIPAQPNRGLSYNFDIECDGGANDIDISAKSASSFRFNSGYEYDTLWENEDMLVLIENEVNQQRNCTLSIVNKATVVLTNGVNILTVDSSTKTIGTRFTPSPTNTVVEIQVTPSINGIYNDPARAYTNDGKYFVVDSQTVQNFVLDTSELNNDDQLNVTVTPITTSQLTSGVKQTFQCVNSGDHHVFALVGNDKSGAVMRVNQAEGVSSVHSHYVVKDRFLNNPDLLHNIPFTRFADSNQVIWIIDAICESDNTNGAITAELPVIQTLSFGKNILTSDTTLETYYVLPEGPGQTTLGVYVNSSSADGWYAAHSFEGSAWTINNNLLTDVVYARDSPVVSPAWYFCFYPVAESVELTLTSFPIVTLESGKTRQFSKPDDTYGRYTIVAKMESSNGLGHALPYSIDYNPDGEDNMRVFINSFYSTIQKRDVMEFRNVFPSEYGNATYYFVVRTTANPDSPINLTATFAPVTTAVNGVIDFSSSAPSDGLDVYNTFLFPAKKRHNALFKYDKSPLTEFVYAGFENVGGYFSTLGGYYISYYMPDSMAAYIVTVTDQSENATIRLESVATIGLCNSQYDCNGHGSCATVADQCTCTDDYSGDWCDVAPTPTPTDDNNNSGAGQMMVFTCQLLVLVAIVSFAF